MGVLSPSIRAACIGLAVFACASFSDLIADLSDLPIGHFKISERADGTINVEARCVGTTQILEALAQRTGKKIIFNKPCHTYTSFWNPKKWSPVEEWLDYIACLSSDSMLVCRLENAEWKVSGLDKAVYDAALSVEEILARYKKPIEAVAESTDGIRTGGLILEGVFIKPPYEIAEFDGGKNRSSVLVNGRQWTECGSSEASFARQKPSLPDSGQIKTADELWSYVNCTLYPQLLNSGMIKNQALRGVVVFLRSQKMVDTVSFYADDPGDRKFTPDSPILVKLKGQKTEISIFFGNLDINTGQLRDWGGATRTSSEHAREIADDLKRHLQANHLVIRASNGSMVTLRGRQLEKLIENIKLAQSQSVAIAECLVSEVIEVRLISREIAANLSGLPRTAIETLKEVAAKK